MCTLRDTVWNWPVNFVLCVKCYQEPILIFYSSSTPGHEKHMQFNVAVCNLVRHGVSGTQFRITVWNWSAIFGLCLKCHQVSILIFYSPSTPGHEKQGHSFPGTGLAAILDRKPWTIQDDNNFSSTTSQQLLMWRRLLNWLLLQMDFTV